MSTSPKLSVAPAFAEQFAELQACNLPPHILESAARLGEATLALDAHEAFIHEVNTEEMIVPDSEQAGSSRICDDLQESGMVSERDVAHVKAVARTVVEQDPEALEDAIIHSWTAFANGFLNPDRVTVKDPPMWRLFSVAKHVADRTDQRLRTGDILHVEQARLDERKAWLATYVKESDQPKVLARPVEEDIDVLRALCMVDVMACVLRLPDGLLTSPREQGGEMNMHPILMAGLVSKLDSEREFKALAVAVFQTAGKLGSLREIFGSLRGVKVASKELKAVLGDYKRVEQYAATYRSVDDTITTYNEASAEHAQTQREAVAQPINQELQQLNQQTKEYVTQASSPERMLGALSVENWIRRVVPATYSRSEKKRWEQDHRFLHEAVDESARRHQLAELAQATEPLQARVRAIDEKYVITAHALRQLPGGLELRQGLSSYLEPSPHRVVFMKNQAQQLVGLALQLAADPERQHDFVDDVAALRQTWANIAFLQGERTVHTGLMQTLDLLGECYEHAPPALLGNAQLQSIWQLARLSQEPPTESE